MDRPSIYEGSQQFIDDAEALVENYINHFQNLNIHNTKMALLQRISNKLSMSNELVNSDVATELITGLKNLAGYQINPATLQLQQQILDAELGQAHRIFQPFIKQDPYRIYAPLVTDNIVSNVDGIKIPTYSNPKILDEIDIPSGANSAWIIAKAKELGAGGEVLSDNEFHNYVESLKKLIRFTLDGSQPHKYGSLMQHYGKLVLPIDLARNLRAISIGSIRGLFEISFSPNKVDIMTREPALIKFDSIAKPHNRSVIQFEINRFEKDSQWIKLPLVKNAQVAIAMPSAPQPNRINFSIRDRHGRIAALDKFRLISYGIGEATVAEIQNAALKLVTSRGNFEIQMTLDDPATTQLFFDLHIAEREKINSPAGRFF